MLEQADLFHSNVAGPEPEGLRFEAEIIDRAEESQAIAKFATLDLEPFQFRGFVGKRRIAAFGWRYDYTGAGFMRAAPLPDFIISLRARAAACAGVPSEQFVQALVSEYAPGAGIGWHRDKPHFGTVVALSFASDCVVRFRRRLEEGWERRALPVPRRGLYLLDGPARQQWQHSIAAVKALRYSLTFRTLAASHA